MPDIDDELIERGPYGRTIRLTVLLDKPVRDRNGEEIGKAHDVFAVRGGPKLGDEPAYRLEHVIAGRGAFGDRLGYDRHDMTGPAPLAMLFNRLKRGALGFRWTDIARIATDQVWLNRTIAELTRVPELPEPERGGRGVGNAVYLGLRLLDSQILDRSGYMCGNVDDLELTLQRGRQAPYVSAVLAGPGALAHRIGGRLGRWIESMHTRLHPEQGGPARIDFADVERVHHQVELRVRCEDVDAHRFEAWVAEHLIAKIPGAS
jgi:sporulation protein YlmC with PRC-barrel domain